MSSRDKFRDVNSMEKPIMKIALIWIIIAFMAALVMSGCIEEKKVEDQKSVINKTSPETQNNTAQNASLSVKKGEKEAPNTPITLSMSIPDSLILNEVTDISIIVKSVLDAPNTRIELILPEGISLVSGDSTWNVNLSANTPKTF